MDHFGAIVEQAAEAVAAEIADDAVTVLFGMALDRMGDIAEAIAGLGLLEAEHQAFIGDIDQLPGLQRNVADQEHPAGIAMPAVENWGNIDIDDVAVLEDLVARDAVAHDMVDRSAATLGVAAVAEGCGDSAGLERHALDDRVDLAGGDAGNDLRHQRVEDFGGEAARAAHPCEALGPVELDHMAARLGAIFGADLDVFGHEHQIGIWLAESRMARRDCMAMGNPLWALYGQQTVRGRVRLWCRAISPERRSQSSSTIAIAACASARPAPVLP